MCACGGTCTEDMRWSQGVHGEFIDGFNLNKLKLIVSSRCCIFKSLRFEGGG